MTSLPCSTNGTGGLSSLNTISVPLKQKFREPCASGLVERAKEKVGWTIRRMSQTAFVISYRISILDDVSRIDNAVYRGVMSLLLSRNVRDFGPARKQAKSVPWEDIEDHHIYPKGFLRPYGIKGEKANNIANRTPMTRTTNGAIGNTAPHVYLTDKKIVGSEPIKPVLEEHLINPELALEPVYSRSLQ